jgi:predicted nuclease of predicted toxin-antitoxin system
MKFKLDENFGARTQHIFVAAGYDAETVHQEKLSGATDKQLYKVCAEEGRCLVTLDMDFADVTRYPPQITSGIVVIRVSRNPSLMLLEQMMRQLLLTLTQHPIEKHLWIVEPNRIRIHQPK